MKKFKMGKFVNVDQLKMLAQRVKKELVSSGLSVPTKLSELTNDTDFLSEDEIKELILDADHMRRKIVSSVDDIDLTGKDSDKIIWLVKQTETGNDGEEIVYYDEYLVIGGKADLMGNTKVDMTGYVKETDAATNAEVTEMLNDVFGIAGSSTPEEPGEDDGET